MLTRAPPRRLLARCCRTLLCGGVSYAQICAHTPAALTLVCLTRRAVPRCRAQAGMRDGINQLAKQAGFTCDKVRSDGVRLVVIGL